jgi:hypothetical protein
MVYPMGIRYPPETRRVWTQVPFFTHGCGYKILPIANVLAGGYLLYPPRTRPVAIAILLGEVLAVRCGCDLYPKEVAKRTQVRHL